MTIALTIDTSTSRTCVGIIHPCAVGGRLAPAIVPTGSEDRVGIAIPVVGLTQVGAATALLV